MIGSDSWTDGARYQKGDAWTARLRFVRQTLNHTAITDHVSSIRGIGTPCVLSENFSAGNFNIVKKITFDDGEQWIIRIRMPPIKQFDENGPIASTVGDDGVMRAQMTELDKRSMESEIATMEYVSLHTKIPIPVLHGYSILHSNPVGYPYLLMSYIHGTTAFEQSIVHGNPFSIPSTFAPHYFAQLASIVLQLASCRFPAIGSITSNTKTSPPTYTTGPIAETGSGAYTNPKEFYTSYPASLATTLYPTHELLTTSGGSKLPSLFSTLSSTTLSPDSAPPQDYGLTNLELGTNNVLVDSSFNILGVIDWDATISAPRAVLHSFPWCLGADPGIPGHGLSSMFPEWADRQELTIRWAEAVEKAARDEAGKNGDEGTIGDGNGRGLLFTKDEFFTKEALSWRAVAFFRVRVIDEGWIRGLRWLEEKSEGEIRGYYGVE